MAEIPLEPIDAVWTGTALDCITGSGVPKSAVILLWGAEGSGKSRLALCALDGWCGSSKGRGFYVLQESMSMAQLRRMADEHGLKHLWMIMPARVDMIDPKMFRRAEPSPHLYVIDSSDETQVVLDAKRGLRSQDSCIIITQATKGGDFLGARAMAHESDVEIEVESYLDVKDPTTMVRLLRIIKNRFGACGVHPIPWPPGDSRQEERR